MKKSYLLIAAAGLIMAACSQEDDFVAQNQTAAGQNDGAVMFDTYLSNTSTRAGKTESMSTKTLQESGFGLIAWQHALTAGTDPWTYGGFKDGNIQLVKAPDFMWNQYVGYESSNWVYSPLKYWPNETTTDQQTSAATSSDKEGVSFFAYAPYVTATTDGTVVTPLVQEDSKEIGITKLSAYDAKGNAMVTYKSASIPSNSVDLLWGTSSGFTYHPVESNAATTQPAGYPVKNMMKPALDEKVKFDFKHALARIGMTVVGAFDQQAAGGNKDIATRVTIDKISIKSAYKASENEKPFALGGILNLNNEVKDRANWVGGYFDFSNSSATNPFTGVYSELVLEKAGEMNPNIQYGYNSLAAKKFPNVQGVTAREQNVIVLKDPWTDVAVTDGTLYNENDGYFDGTTPVEEASGALAYKLSTPAETHFLMSDGEKYTYYTTTAPPVDVTKTVKALTAAPTNLTKKTENADENVIYLKQGTAATLANEAVFNVINFTDIPGKKDDDLAANTYYTVPKTQFNGDALAIKYAKTSYKSVKKNAGYFMVVPTTKPDDPADVKVTVEITYYVTTKDAKLAGETSEVKNVISQDVILKKFTNGKSYNLKLILGLTSVKVEAEVSNWEVGTVESNLPQNLE